MSPLTSAHGRARHEFWVERHVADRVVSLLATTFHERAQVSIDMHGKPPGWTRDGPARIWLTGYDVETREIEAALDDPSIVMHDYIVVPLD